MSFRHVSSESVELGSSKPVVSFWIQSTWVSKKSMSCAPQRPKPVSTAWRWISFKGCRMLPCLTGTVRAWLRLLRRQWRLICLVLACSGQCVLVEQLCVVLRKRLVDDICLTLSPELIWSSDHTISFTVEALISAVKVSKTSGISRAKHS